MFSFNRFYEQLKIVLFHGTRKHGTMLLIFLLYFLLSHFNIFNHMTLSDKDPYSSFELITVLAAVLSSIEVFGRLRMVNSGINYLMLPATTLEKFLAAFLYTTIGTFLVYTLSFGVVHALIIGGNNLTSSVELAYSFPSAVELWNVFKTLLFIQSLFFLGSLVFKKSPLAMTLLVIISCILVFTFVMSWQFFHQITFDNNLLKPDEIGSLQAEDAFSMIKNALTIGSWILPFACWTAAYFRLKSTQI